MDDDPHGVDGSNRCAAATRHCDVPVGRWRPFWFTVTWPRLNSSHAEKKVNDAHLHLHSCVDNENKWRCQFILNCVTVASLLLYTSSSHNFFPGDWRHNKSRCYAIFYAAAGVWLQQVIHAVGALLLLQHPLVPAIIDSHKKDSLLLFFLV